MKNSVLDKFPLCPPAHPPWKSKEKNPPRKTTHPNKPNWKQFGQTVCPNSSACLLFSLREKGRTVCTNSPENCLRKLFLLGWVVFGVGFPSLEKSANFIFFFVSLSLKRVSSAQVPWLAWQALRWIARVHNSEVSTPCCASNENFVVWGGISWGLLVQALSPPLKGRHANPDTLAFLARIYP